MDEMLYQAGDLKDKTYLEQIAFEVEQIDKILVNMKRIESFMNPEDVDEIRDQASCFKNEMKNLVRTKLIDEML